MSHSRPRFADWLIRLVLVLVALTATPALAQRASISPASGSTLPQAAASQPYSMSFSGVGGLPPYEFHSLGGLPPGLSLGLRGELSGTPTTVGSYTVNIGFMDANGREDTGTYKLEVVAPADVLADSFGARTRDFLTTRQQLLARSIDLPGLGDRRGSVPFDIWIDGVAGWHAGGEAGSGGFGVSGIGADYLVNDRLLLGLALYGDWMRAGTANSETSGTGVLAGPYASIGLGETATLDVSLFYGRSSNDISAELFGASYVGSFETSRWLAHARLEGLWQADMLAIRPRAQLSVASETAEAYGVSGPLGAPVTIEGFTTTTLTASLGADLETTHDLGNGLVLQPRLALDVGIADAVPSAGLTAGFALTGAGGWDASAGVAAGLDGNGLGSVALRGGLGIRF